MVRPLALQSRFFDSSLGGSAQEPGKTGASKVCPKHVMERVRTCRARTQRDSRAGLDLRRAKVTQVSLSCEFVEGTKSARSVGLGVGVRLTEALFLDDSRVEGAIDECCYR
jgi:hypothetical protein